MWHVFGCSFKWSRNSLAVGSIILQMVHNFGSEIVVAGCTKYLWLSRLCFSKALPSLNLICSSWKKGTNQFHRSVLWNVYSLWKMVQTFHRKFHSLWDICPHERWTNALSSHIPYWSLDRNIHKWYDLLNACVANAVQYIHTTNIALAPIILLTLAISVYPYHFSFFLCSQIISVDLKSIDAPVKFATMITTEIEEILRLSTNSRSLNMRILTKISTSLYGPKRCEFSVPPKRRTFYRSQSNNIPFRMDSYHAAFLCAFAICRHHRNG